MSQDLALEKGLPASLDCEKLVLGALITGTEYQLVAGTLEADDFSLEKHRRIFLRMGELYNRGERIDRVTVANELRKQNQLEVDGVSYLASLDEGMPALANLESYVQIVKDKAILRRIVLNSNKLRDECLMGQDSPGEIISRFGDLLRDLESETAPKATLRSFGEILDDRGGINSYGRERDLGIQTPWHGLNRVIGGFRPGQMITIAGLTGTGKSAIALQIAQHAAEHSHVGTALFSLEMGAEEILDRAACSRAGIDSKKLELGTLTASDRLALSKAVSQLVKLPLWVDATTGCTLPAMHAALRRHIQKHKIGLLIVDYLQLMQVIGRKENRTQEVTEISRGMKLAAREFQIPVVVLAQFNRGPAAEGRVPELHDLRESGSIEQDSDKCIFVHTGRIEKDAKNKTVWRPPVERDGFTESLFIVAKQRNGASRRILKMLFADRFARFHEEGPDGQPIEPSLTQMGLAGVSAQ